MSHCHNRITGITTAAAFTMFEWVIWLLSLTQRSNTSSTSGCVFMDIQVSSLSSNLFQKVYLSVYLLFKLYMYISFLVDFYWVDALFTDSVFAIQLSSCKLTFVNKVRILDGVLLWRWSFIVVFSFQECGTLSFQSFVILSSLLHAQITIQNWFKPLW